MKLSTTENFAFQPVKLQNLLLPAPGHKISHLS